jgi:hypothetical protein
LARFFPAYPLLGRASRENGWFGAAEIPLLGTKIPLLTEVRNSPPNH